MKEERHSFLKKRFACAVESKKTLLVQIGVAQEIASAENADRKKLFAFFSRKRRPSFLSLPNLGSEG
jgi:hypothetical protein